MNGQLPSAPEDIHKKLMEILGGAKTDDSQLERLAEAARAELVLPVDAFMIGEPVKVMAIEYDGNVRRGLSAVVRRGEERYHVNLGDVVFIPGIEGSKFSVVYRTWLGLETGGSKPARVHPHKAEAGDPHLGDPIDLIVLACKSNALRCRVPGTERELTLRIAVRDEVPGEIITVIPAKQWTHARHPYLSGKVHKTRVEVAARDLVPLALRREGNWDPEDEY